MKIRTSDVLPFALLFPPMLSLYSETFGTEMCWVPGWIVAKYIEWFRIPAFDRFAFAWIPVRVPGFIGDLVSIYLLFGSLNAKTVNYVETTAAPGSVGVRRIVEQIARRQLRLAGKSLKDEAKLVLLWPRTLRLMYTYYRMSRPAGQARPPQYFGDLVERMSWVGGTALGVVPLIAGTIFFVGVRLCGPGESVRDGAPVSVWSIVRIVQTSIENAV